MKAIGVNQPPSKPRPSPPPCPPLVMGHVTPASGGMFDKPFQSSRKAPGVSGKQLESIIADLTQKKLSAESRADAWKAMAERLAEELHKRHEEKPLGHKGQVALSDFAIMMEKEPPSTP